MINGEKRRWCEEHQMCLCEYNFPPPPKEICNLQLISLELCASDETVPIPSSKCSVHLTCQCCVHRRMI